MIDSSPFYRAAAGRGRTVEEFEAHIIARAGGVSRQWTNGVAVTTATVRALNVPTGGQLTGSPWLSRTATGNTLSRVMQHALPSQDAWLDQISRTGLMFYVSSDAGSIPVPAVNRNGFQSASGGALVIMTELLFFTDRAYRMAPNLGQGPFPYDWTD